MASPTALHAGKDWQVALAAHARPGLASGGLYLRSRWQIKLPSLAGRPVASDVLCWFPFVNPANLYDYV